MTQPTLFPPPQLPDVTRDICANKHKGNRNSVKANKQANRGKSLMCERVRVFIAGCGYEGTTLKHISAAFNKLPHQLSGRISDLKAAKKIFDSGRDHENGCSILVASKQWVNGSSQ